MTRRSHSIPARLGSAALLLFQLALAGVVPVADAQLEAAAVNGAVHVEDAADGPCGPTHDHRHCQLCRAITWAGTNSAGVPTPHLRPAVMRPPLPEQSLPQYGTSVSGPLGPRAPPRA